MFRRLLGLHHFQPPFNGFFDIGYNFFITFPLRKTAWKCWNLSHIISMFILFNDHMKFHLVSFFNFKFPAVSTLFLIIVGGIQNGLHCFFHGVTFYCVRFTLDFKNTLFKTLPLSLFFDKIPDIIPYFFNSFLREIRNHFINIRYVQSLHIFIINNNLYHVKTYGGSLLCRYERAILEGTRGCAPFLKPVTQGFSPLTPPSPLV